MNKLHLGCGPVILDGWINIDLDSPAADLRHDLTKPLPFEDSTASHVFAEHLIEHIGHAQAQALLAECWRVLEPGGTIRITTPDLNWLATVYLSSLTHLWGDLWQPASPCAMLNEGMREWGHQFLYDSPELHALLSNAGFSRITEHAWRESDDPELAGLESRVYHRELIVEARKLPQAGAETIRYSQRRYLADREMIDHLLVEQGVGLQARDALLRSNHFENKRLRVSIGELESENRRLLQGVRDSEGREAMIVAEAAKLREVIVDREAVIADMKQQFSLQEERVGASELVAQQSSEWARTLQEEIERRGQRIAFLEGMVDDLTTHIGGIESESASRAAAVAALVVEVDVLKSSLGELERRSSEIDARCVEQAAVIEALTDDVRAKAETIEEQGRILSSLQSGFVGRWALRRYPTSK